ncbi:HutD/Ves family protein [Comamonas composti]|uniref:HutD/Ves family protein n=1 Tax=Comamonas composti TaxID=408558 RepID=UPI0004163247|nr:HutD family protein [Comamonas composti]
MQDFDLSQIAPSPWKNGGGSTREIVCWPPGAGLDDFGWRISVAEIARPGPFSRFAGVDRHILLLAGDGVHLRGPGVDQRLDQRWQPFAFAGETPLDCALPGAASEDFNVMVRRGQWTARLQVCETPVTAGCADAGLCLVLQGSFALRGPRGARLQPGQGRHWSRPWPAMQLQPGDADSRLLLVRLQQL